MQNSVGNVALGTILCKYCGNLIDTVDMEKVTIFYSNCKQEPCIQQESQTGQVREDCD
jgi:hypothetical protein